MSDENDQYRDWVGAYVLGSLEPAERVAYEQHLRTCATCQAEVNELAAFPGLLAQIDPNSESDTAALARITGLAAARADHDYRHLATATKRWRWAALASAAAAMVLLVVLAAGMLGGTDTGPAGTELAITQTEASGTVVVAERPWGTSIDLDLVGLAPRDSYQLWAIDTAGNWTTAATWQSTPQGLARLTGAAAVATGDVNRIVITSTDRDDVLLDART